MNPPSFSVRVAGSPIVAVPLTVGGVLLVYAWMQGRVSFLLALVGFFVVTNTLSAARRLRTYNAWRKEWDGVGTFGAQPVESKRQLWRALTVVAGILFVGLLIWWPQLRDAPQLQEFQQWVSLLWGLSAVFLFARACIGVRALARKRPARKITKAAGIVTPISWMLTSTADSPSREMAMRSLPEYAACVLNGRSVEKNASR